MKHFLCRSRPAKPSSFTLVELLVVIAIISILASVILYAGNLALKSAKRAKAANMATQIQTACLGYYTEYSIYPVGTATTDSAIPASINDSDATDWGNLIEALCGNIKPSTGLAATQTAIANTRGIAFLTLKTSDVDTHDAPLNPLPTGTEIYFNIAMDADYNGVIGTGTSAASLPNFAAGTTSGFSPSSTGGTTTAGVAVWANCNGSTSSQNANFWVHTY
jgi:prepilin-type N-terminal cleavage/methylation domain-containing protein